MHSSRKHHERRSRWPRPAVDGRLAVVALSTWPCDAMGYPFDLDEEGNIVEHVQRVLDGKPSTRAPRRIRPVSLQPALLLPVGAGGQGQATALHASLRVLLPLALRNALRSVARGRRAALPRARVGILAPPLDQRAVVRSGNAPILSHGRCFSVPPVAFVLPNKSVAFSLARPLLLGGSWPSRTRFHRLWPWRLERGPCVISTFVWFTLPAYCSPAKRAR